MAITITGDNCDWMRGFPPAIDKIIRFGDGSYYQWPQLQWTLSHIEQLVPTKPVWRGPKAAKNLLEAPIQPEAITLTLANGQTMNWTEALEHTCCDAFGVLHKGRLIYEKYSDQTDRHTSHVIQSCAKSFAGLIGEILIEQGHLNEAALIPQYLPELTDTAWGDATLRQVMDMQIGMDFDENYEDPASVIWTYLRAAGMLPTDPGEPVVSLCNFLPTIPKKGEHGLAFCYREPNINVLTWVIQRVTNKALNTLMSEMIWQHIGAEHDARYMADPDGLCTTASCTLRDFIKFGELVRTGGKNLISTKIRSSIFVGGDVEKFAKYKHPTMKNWSYRSQWWIRHLDSGNCAVARGAHGQLLYIDPANEIVIARFGSQKQAPGFTYDDIIFPMFDALIAMAINPDN